MIKHENIEKKHPCHICGAKFTLPGYVKSHISKYHKPEDYIGNCEECGRGYKQAFQIRDCCHEIKIAKFRNNQQQAIQVGQKAIFEFEEESIGAGKGVQLAITAPSSLAKQNVTVVYSKAPLIIQNLPSSMVKKDK